MMIRGFILSLLFISISISSIRSQTMELKEVWIDCDTIIRYDSILFKPISIHFSFLAINEKQNELCVGTYSSPEEKELKFGYFEMKMDSTRQLKLNSRYQLMSIPANSSRRMTADDNLCEDISLEKFPYSSIDLYNIIVNIEDSCSVDDEKGSKSKKCTYDYLDNKFIIKIANSVNSSFINLPEIQPELFSYIIDNEIFYYNIEHDYKETECSFIFPNLKVTKNTYLITIAYDGVGLFYYPAKKPDALYFTLPD